MMKVGAGGTAMKTCTGPCGETKPLGEFPLGRGRLGRRSRCNECKRLEAKEYRERNKDKIKARYKERKHLYLATNKAYREKNADAIKKQKAEKYRADPDTAKKRVRDWQMKNPEKVSQYKKRNADTHYSEYRKNARARYANEPDPKKRMRYHYAHRSDPEYLAKRAANLRKDRARLTDSYVAHRLRSGKRKEEEFPQELIEMKREQLQVRRLVNQLKEKIR